MGVCTATSLLRVHSPLWSNPPPFSQILLLLAVRHHEVRDILHILQMGKAWLNGAAVDSTD
jgi:hypothetical protein